MNNNKLFKINPFTGLLFLVLFAALAFLIVRGLWQILSFFAPFLFIASFILDKSVPIGFFKWLGKQYKINVLGGLGITLVCGFGFPFLFAFLFARSLVNYRLGKHSKASKDTVVDGDYIEFEELEDPLDLPRLNKN